LPRRPMKGNDIGGGVNRRCSETRRAWVAINKSRLLLGF